MKTGIVSQKGRLGRKIRAMGQYFPHEQLDVYGFAVKFAGFADGLLGSWPAFRAVHDQFDRATESILINIAKAARLRATDKGIFHIAEGNGRFSMLDHNKFIVIAEDTGTKLATYLDIAGTTWQAQVERAKAKLREVMAVLTGLRGYLQNVP